MTVNVRGRNIEIDDKLARRYESIGQGPVSEIFVLDELATLYRKDPLELARTMPEKELVDFIHSSIRDYLRIMGVQDE
jgi:hypothetical protein